MLQSTRIMYYLREATSLMMLAVGLRCCCWWLCLLVVLLRLLLTNDYPTDCRARLLYTRHAMHSLCVRSAGRAALLAQPLQPAACSQLLAATAARCLPICSGPPQRNKGSHSLIALSSALQLRRVPRWVTAFLCLFCAWQLVREPRFGESLAGGSHEVSKEPALETASVPGCGAGWTQG